MNLDDLTADQRKQIADLKAMLPYRIVFGCLHPTTGEFETHATYDRRRMNNRLRKGWKVYVATANPATPQAICQYTLMSEGDSDTSNHAEQIQSLMAPWDNKKIELTVCMKCGNIGCDHQRYGI